ncbi:type II toxin-antitoxin system VapC family toxin [Candidatus Woesearchaeota archaeon]|nr:type II toxin-antitoxin system VapC family toxin [Candidatus Woesearchaeota archaeon]
MTYLLDTSVLIDMKRGNPTIIRALRQLLGVSQTMPSITLFTYSEYYLGSIKEGKQVEAADFLNQFAHLNFSLPSARLFSELNYKYKIKGIVFDTLDLMNASIAINEQLVFVTSDKFFNNLTELRKIIIPR